MQKQERKLLQKILLKSHYTSQEEMKSSFKSKERILLKTVELSESGLKQDLVKESQIHLLYLARELYTAQTLKK